MLISSDPVISAKRKKQTFSSRSVRDASQIPKIGAGSNTDSDDGDDYCISVKIKLLLLLAYYLL